MYNLKGLITVTVILVLFYSISYQRAFAYLDPGTGSYILQLIIAVLVGGGFAVKIFWKRIKPFFVDLFSRRKENGKVEN